jgi:hypothetical protein
MVTTPFLTPLPFLLTNIVHCLRVLSQAGNHLLRCQARQGYPHQDEQGSNPLDGGELLAPALGQRFPGPPTGLDRPRIGMERLPRRALCQTSGFLYCRHEVARDLG